MSDCDCDHDDNGDSNGEDKKYEAQMKAGELFVHIEGESSEEAQRRVEELWERTMTDVKTLNEEERRSVNLK